MYPDPETLAARIPVILKNIRGGIFFKILGCARRPQIP
eukprot:SAG31_NODE_44220_length_263_cov_1.524390_1_plen_37_part_10